MKPHCLNKVELNRFISIASRNGEISDEEAGLQRLVESWHNYDTELICLATTLSQILEQKIKMGENTLALLENIYGLEQSGRWLSIEGFGENFVRYFLDYSRNAGLTIEDDLNYLREQFGEYNYR